MAHAHVDELLDFATTSPASARDPEDLARIGVVRVRGLEPRGVLRGRIVEACGEPDLLERPADLLAVLPQASRPAR